MNPAFVLLFLRIVSALLLLAFLGGIAWLIYQDMAAVTEQMVGQAQASARLLWAENDESFVLLPVTSIGRAGGNTIVLDDGYISNEHALFTRREQRWWVEDLGSRNGTLVNGTEIEGAVVLRPGDVITVGDIELILEVES